jgi:RNA recognition motif-containing protein
MSAKLFVGNLPHTTTSDELRSLFSEVGPVESCSVIIDRETGRSKGFGFVEMNSIETADAAKEKLDGQEVNGRALTVKDAKPKSESYRGGNGNSRY